MHRNQKQEVDTLGSLHACGQTRLSARDQPTFDQGLATQSAGACTVDLQRGSCMQYNASFVTLGFTVLMGRGGGAYIIASKETKRIIHGVEQGHLFG